MKSKIIRFNQFIIGEFQMIKSWFANIYFVFFTTQSKPKIFTGYGHWWLAQKYADKRTKISQGNKVAGGKRHYVLPSGDYSLIVINKVEINSAKSRGFIPKSLNINKILTNAYYISK